MLFVVYYPHIGGAVMEFNLAVFFIAIALVIVAAVVAVVVSVSGAVAGFAHRNLDEEE
ncbi:hypothetical protein BRYFOR_08629 [Marvinbryantia formatexigens DSM 14469]|uniref:Transmembrane protein n=1 Tax=Marvinbryantia formatexigens DSM 14469 TaxID=478749 RepID=C6LIZ5_9FIRM|nr:hypothetical protein BRYFOR_08629 [Marvinbryantia formatexigens DSM 14469]